VHKATWKGTEVAVKVVMADKITRDMENEVTFTSLGTGAGNDFAATSQRGPIHGGFDQGSQDVQVPAPAVPTPHQSAKPQVLNPK
jgi:hypothetical protein